MKTLFIVAALALGAPTVHNSYSYVENSIRLVGLKPKDLEIPKPAVIDLSKIKIKSRY